MILAFPPLFPIRWILPLLTILGLSFANAEDPQTATPSIHFEQTLHDFGRLLEGTIAKHEFTFTNSGTADLVISHVQPSCGCTTTPDWSPVVPPGGKGRIPLVFNTHGMLGQVQKSLAIHSNDPAQPIVVLLLGGIVWKPLELHPAVAVIQMPPNTKGTLSTTVRIVNQTDHPLTLQPPVATPSDIRTSLQEITPGKEYHLVIDMDVPEKHQDLNGTITIATSSSEVPRLSIPLIVIAQPVIVVNPPQMFLPAVPPDFPEPYIINVLNQGSDTITLGPATCDAPGSKVEIRETIPGREFQLAVTFPPDLAYIENQTYSIIAKTSNPSQPEVRVHVAFARPPVPIPARPR